MKLSASLLALLVIGLPTAGIAENVIRVHVPISQGHTLPAPSPDPIEEPQVPNPEPIARASCLEILQSGESAGSGVYTITLPGGQQKVYCDMGTAGGGWTMVAAQYEADPVSNWNEGIQSDYDPSLATKRGFALSTAQIPNHTETGFGQDLDPAAADYGDLVYTTGNIGTPTVLGKRTGLTYRVHRSKTQFWAGHQIGSTLYSNSDPYWINTLTFDATTVRNKWAFAPNAQLAAAKGYSLNGALSSSSNSFAWTVWVR